VFAGRRVPTVGAHHQVRPELARPIVASGADSDYSTVLPQKIAHRDATLEPERWVFLGFVGEHSQQGRLRHRAGRRAAVSRRFSEDPSSVGVQLDELHLDMREAVELFAESHLPKGIVVGVWLQLRPGIRAEIARIVKDYLHYRKDTQPLAMPSAGCVFKNPPRDSAGRLLEAAGLKGMRIGDAEVSTKHGNFIVNRGHASAADVIGLIQKVRRMIKRKTGVRLDLELKIVGEA